MSLLWGIDLGGTKIEGAVIDSEIGPEQPLCRIRKPTERDKGYQHVLNQMRAVFEDMIATVGEKPYAIGVGTPGAVDPQSGQLKNSNTTCLNGMPLRDDVRKLFGIDVEFANDANCFAMAESTWGVAQGARVVFGVILGTGVGGGIVVNGKTVEGAHGIAGEWGHNVLDPTGEFCYCGKRGCVEVVLSGPALERYYRSIGGLADAAFEQISQGDDASSAQTKQRLFEKFGQAIGAVINILDPDIVVLGGGVGSTPGLAERASEFAAPFVFNRVVRTRFERPRYGSSAGVFGAAALTKK